MTNVSLALVIDAIVKASVVLGVAGLVAASLRRASASARHFVWTLGLLSALAAPALSLALPRWELPIVTVAATPRVEPSPAASTATAPPLRAKHERSAGSVAGPSIDLPPANETQAPTAPALPSWPVVAFAVWALGAFAIVSRMLVGLLAVQWMSRRTPEVASAPWLAQAQALARELGLSRVRFLRGAAGTMPMAWGIVRQSVVVPSDADAWPAHRVRVVLLHELAHVKRRDCLTHLVAQLACAAYWFNPLVWMAARRLRTERERACDDLVLAAGTRGSDYADQLLDIARVMHAGRFPAVFAGASLAMAQRSQLEGRLMAILDPSVPRRGLSRARAAAAAVVFAAVMMTIASVQPWAEARSVVDPSVADDVRAAAAASQSKSERTAQAADEKRVAAQDQSSAPSSGIRGGVPGGIAGGIHGGIAGGIAGGMAGGIPGGVAGGIAGGVADGVARGVAGGVPGSVARSVAASVPGSVATSVVRGLAGGISGGVAGGVAGGFATGVERGFEKPVPWPTPARGQGAQGPQQPQADQGDQDEQDDQDTDTRKGGSRDPRTVNALVEALKDTDKDVRETAMHALVQMRDPRIFDPLVTALKDASADVREQAAFGLGQLRDARAITPLAAALKDANASVREQVVFALGQLRAAGVADAIAQALRDSSPSVREQAAFALGQMRDRKAIEPLISALKDENASVREQAAFALGQMRAANAIEALVVALKDANPSVREQVAFALGQIGDPRAIDGLMIALKDTSASVRQQAAFALGQIR
jgi:HEAT repeat protein/beta-lactamase regulating signal transducer with metallopeptidase domain